MPHGVARESQDFSIERSAGNDAPKKKLTASFRAKKTQKR